MLAVPLLQLTSETGKDSLLLDLAEPEIRQKLDSRTGGCGGGRLTGLSHGDLGRPTLPTEMHFELLDGEGYSVGEAIVYEVRFTNRGHQPVWFPWSPYSETAYGKGCQWPAVPGARALRGWVQLAFEDQQGYVETIAAQDLYGISTQPSSYRVLAPGETVRVRAAGKVNFSTIIEKRIKEHLPFALPQAFAATASFGLDDSSLPNPCSPLRSSNQLEVLVTEK